MADPHHVIRPAEPSDAGVIRAVHTAAFGGEAEAGLVAALQPDLVILSYVAALDGAVVAHVLFSRMWVHGRTERWPCAALAPLAVLPTFQGQGLGGRLARAGLLICQESGYDLALVLGDPAYYSRFGFEAAAPHGIEAPDASWGTAFQVRELAPGALGRVRGRAVYPSAFDGV